MNDGRELPMLQHSVVDQLRRNAVSFGSRTAIEEIGGPSYSYAEIWRRIVALADSLADVPERDGLRVVLLLLPNCADAALAQLACQLAGCVAVPVNGTLAVREIDEIAADAGASTVMARGHFVELVGELSTPMRLIDCATIPTPDEVSFRRATADGAAPMAVGYTSGTTGLPKGAVFSNDAVYARYLRWGWQFGLTGDQVVLTAGPMFHMSYGGLSIMTLLVGARLRIMPRFDAETACTELAEQCTFAFLVPTMIDAVLWVWQQRGRSPLSSARLLLSSGAPIARELLSTAIEAFPHARIAEAYGWSEGSWVTFETKDLDNLRAQSVGWPMVGADVEILDEDRNPCPVGVPGEIASRDLIGFSGYLNRPEETAAAFHEGYVLSGDIGVRDDDGRIRIIDRKKDMIVTGGENVYSAEVERALAEHPDLVEVAVVGRRDPRWGEVVTAVVVTTDDALTEADIRTFARTRLAPFKVPKVVEIVPSLPRNAMGKVQKFLLRSGPSAPPADLVAEPASTKG
jgi:acyl-CoA synthetase (AMP-forming)/AMP-acid ligase II